MGQENDSTGGDPQIPDESSEELFSLLQEELRRIAARHMALERAGHTLQPTALVNEAFLKLHDRIRGQKVQRSDFLAMASSAMRRVLVDLGRERNAAKRRAQRVHLTIEAIPHTTILSIEDMLALGQAIDRLSAREPSGQRQATLVDYVWLGGMSFTEAAKTLGISRRQAHRDWAFARVWLARQLSA